jgi:RND family efflux transporter MFP subunit
VRTTGLVRYDETRLSDINLRVEAWIRALDVDYTGQFVRKGQPLFTVYSPELLSTQQEYALALKSREQFAHAQMPETRQYADRLVDSARQRLALWDLSPDQIQALAAGGQPQPEAVFRSPATGYVIEKRAVQGMHVMPGESLYKVVDLSDVWVEADVREQELTVVRRGAQAIVTVDAYPEARFQGRVTYQSPLVDETTRTVKARIELPNRDGRLKPGMYANVEFSAPVRTGLAVPVDAVLDSGAEHVVFVAQGEGHFEPRHVTVGQRLGDTIEIRDGLKAGEQVATGATFFLDSESQLRASLQGFAPAAAPASAAKAEDAHASVAQLLIAVRRQPEPARHGENQFEVEVKTPDGTPVTDGEVTVAFYMAPMPTMNMPAMRNEAKLPHAGHGIYRGTATVMMAGRWDVSVIVTRAGQQIGTKTLTVVAR